MQQILIIGNAGSGKSTFAKHLAQKLNLPLVHLDRLFWTGNWEHLDREKFDAVLQTELKKPEWIIDGNFNRTLPHRLQYCDTVFFFDLPTLTCLQGITKRTFTHYGKTRSDMGGNCPEHFDKHKIELYSHVLTFNKQHRKAYYALLNQAPQVHTIVFKSRKQADAFLKNI